MIVSAVVILAVIGLIFTVVHALGKLPLWPAVLLLCIALLLVGKI